MRYFFVCGEASGDLHASYVIKDLIDRQKDCQVCAWGGDKMEAAGAQMKMHYAKLAFMGFWEVFKNLRRIISLVGQCKQDILEFKPDVIVLVDYPGFNLRIARFAKKQGIRVIYYISPKVWVWRASRVNMIKRVVDKMLVIFPFEKAFYKRYDFEVNYVGNPVLDAVDNYQGEGIRTYLEDKNKTVIGLIPGSRVQEVRRAIPLMLALSRINPNYQFVLSCMSHLKEEYVEINEPNVKLVYDDAYTILKDADAAVVTSGTATLEAALFNVPQMVCYMANDISYMIGKRVVNVEYISLVNLILDKTLVVELVQNQFNLSNMQYELEKLVEDETYRQTIISGYENIKNLLGDGPVAPRVVDEILDES